MCPGLALTSDITCHATTTYDSPDITSEIIGLSGTAAIHNQTVTQVILMYTSHTLAVWWPANFQQRPASAQDFDCAPKSPKMENFQLQVFYF